MLYFLVCLLLSSLANCSATAIETSKEFPDGTDIEACSHPSGAALLQTKSVDAGASSPSETSLDVTTSVGIPTDLAFTTNAGQSYNECPGSNFSIDQTGTFSGLVMKQGLRLTKGSCALDPKDPRTIREMACDTSSGCHVWCAPVWNSWGDTLDWRTMDRVCSNWDGNPTPEEDPMCNKASRVYTWGRAVLPGDVVSINMVFAILGDICKEHCTGLQVTVYDTQSWSKTFRWCFNHKRTEVNHNAHLTEMSACDVAEDMALGAWRDRHFHLLTNFTGKFDYQPRQFAVELAVYSEFGASEVLVSSIDFTKAPRSLTAKATKINSPDLLIPVGMSEGENDEDFSTPVPSSADDTEYCGVIPKCPEGSRCCRARTQSCCPATFQCCGDLCCPRYHKCSAVSGKSAECLAPTTATPPVRPQWCGLMPTTAKPPIR